LGGRRGDSGRNKSSVLSLQSSERAGKVGIRSKEKEDMKIISVIFPHADIAD